MSKVKVAISNHCHQSLSSSSKELSSSSSSSPYVFTLSAVRVDLGELLLLLLVPVVVVVERERVHECVRVWVSKRFSREWARKWKERQYRKRNIESLGSTKFPHTKLSKFFFKCLPAGIIIRTSITVNADCRCRFSRNIVFLLTKGTTLGEF